MKKCSSEEKANGKLMMHNKCTCDDKTTEKKAFTKIVENRTMCIDGRRDKSDCAVHVLSAILLWLFVFVKYPFFGRLVVVKENLHMFCIILENWKLKKWKLIDEHQKKLEWMVQSNQQNCDIFISYQTTQTSSTLL